MRKIGVVMIVMVCLILGWILSAQNTLAQEEGNSMVAAYAEVMQIDYAEAERRLRLQGEMSLVEQKVAEDEAYFASWTQHEPIFGLVVSFSAPDGEERIQKYLEGMEWADLVIVQESDITREELRNLRTQVVAEANKTGIVFGSGLNYITGRVTLYAEDVEELREYLEGNAEIAPILDRVEFIQEQGAAPAAYDYPYLLGGHALSQCTSGFPVYRVSDGMRFISTSGHCDNSQDVRYNGTSSIYMGNAVWENDPVLNVGPFGNDLDFQVHDPAGARSFDLTNRIKTDGGAATTQSVIGTDVRTNTLNDWVCKNGRMTDETCGYVADVDYDTVNPDYGGSDNYVRVNRPWLSQFNILCVGDSGSPVYRYEEAGGVTALGILSGGENAGCTGVSIGPASYFFYSPIDYINWSPYRILTTHYPQQYYLHVFATDGTCTEYKTPIDAYGNPIWSQQTSQSCQSAPGSGTVQSYNGFVTGHKWREGLWRDTSPNDTGWARAVPLNANGTINWGGANWSQCCSGTGPAAQDGYIVGNHYYLNVFAPAGSCVEYITPLNNNGDPIWANQTSQACRTAAPGSGTVQSYNAFVSGQTLREGIWRGGLGYSRSVPLNVTNTDVAWPTPPGSGWTQCCSGTAPAAQGGELTSHP